MARLRPNERLVSEGLVVSTGVALLLDWRLGLILLVAYWVPAFSVRGR